MAERSRWQHALCRACYAAVEPGRAPHLVIDAPPDACCRCDEIADPPIYYRADPVRFGCAGVHHEPDDGAA